MKSTTARDAYKKGWDASKRTKTYDLDMAELRFERTYGSEYVSEFNRGWTNYAADMEFNPARDEHTWEIRDDIAHCDVCTAATVDPVAYSNPCIPDPYRPVAVGERARFKLHIGFVGVVVPADERVDDGFDVGLKLVDGRVIGAMVNELERAKENDR